jgi:OPA family glycerol-3-phosphate transporter-like MFS transporter
MSGPAAVPYSDLPRSFHRWKWRILLCFAGFYLFIYLGRFNFWPVAPLVKQELGLSNIEVGLLNAALLWGFMIGEVVHGRLAEAYGLRLWVLLGAVLTVVFNWVTSFGNAALTLAIPLALAGFANAACFPPGASMISQWWPRRDRGMAFGILLTASGGAMLIMWWFTGLVGAEFGWRAGFRYPPLIIVVLGVAFYLLTRDRPSDAGEPEYVEEDEVSATPEALPPERLRGLGPYKVLLSNPRFQLACHVKGLENVTRHGLTTWVPTYYFEEAGLSIESTVLLTVLLPLGYLIAPPIAGIASDRLLHSARRPMVLMSCGVSAMVLAALAFAPPDNISLGAALLLVGGLAIGMSPMAAMAVDVSGRRMSGTASGLLDAHGYLYSGTMAIVFSVLLDMGGSPWPIIFLFMAGTRILAAGMIARVRV